MSERRSAMMRNYDSKREMAAIDRRLKREREFEDEIRSLQSEVRRLRGFLQIVSCPVSPDIVLAEDFAAASSREFARRIGIAQIALRGAALQKKSPAEAGAPPLEGSGTADMVSKAEAAGMSSIDRQLMEATDDPH